jgi:predicted protein tyrosine phosphatase
MCSRQTASAIGASVAWARSAQEVIERVHVRAVLESLQPEDRLLLW